MSGRALPRFALPSSRASRALRDAGRRNTACVPTAARATPDQGELFGYGLTVRPLLQAVGRRRAIRLALASDTASITTMEIVDNLFILAVPGALAAGLTDGLFWW